MIDTIIFDIGRVLVRFDWKEYIDSFSFDAETAQTVGAAIFQSPVWNEYDRGSLSDEEILSLLCANAPDYKDEICMVFEQFPSSLEELPHTMPWITSLKEQGYKLYYLSNFPKTPREKCGDVLRFTNLCDGGVMSYEVHLTKPEPEIYQALLDRYPIDADHAVFIDDLEKNLTAAEAFGLHTIQFTDYESTSAKLNTLLHP